MVFTPVSNYPVVTSQGMKVKPLVYRHFEGSKINHILEKLKYDFTKEKVYLYENKDDESFKSFYISDNGKDRKSFEEFVASLQLGGKKNKATTSSNTVNDN